MLGTKRQSRTTQRVEKHEYPAPYVSPLDIIWEGMRSKASKEQTEKEIEKKEESARGLLNQCAEEDPAGNYLNKDVVEDLTKRMHYDDQQIETAKDRGKWHKDLKWGLVKRKHIDKYLRVAKTTHSALSNSRLVKRIDVTQFNYRKQGGEAEETMVQPPQETSNVVASQPRADVGPPVRSTSEPIFANTRGVHDSLGLSDKISSHEYVLEFKRSIIHRARHNALSLEAVGWHPDDSPALESSVTQIANWIAQVDYKSNIFWLWHEAERGRDNVLRYVAHALDKHKALASAFFFPRVVGKTQTSTRVGFVPTLAQEAVKYIPSLARALDDACVTRGEFAFKRNIVVQMTELFIGACVDLVNSGDPAAAQRPLLVVINSLDRATPADSLEIISAMQACVEKLPISFLVSSKRTEWIEDKLQNWGLKDRTHMGVYEATANGAAS
ncbi:hypothetical protein DFP72DRAFT_907544 [Ephemerocybe angulata]|uniref:Uncharacterized protein n=1 Tax=Ephemerocybe angulata TaxID=980116 RepID=A0A8H6HS87_9AGAR|nr:hypothetical protein DFP72DRAFT_907544 [Tulosesus angulatus]